MKSAWPTTSELQTTLAAAGLLSVPVTGAPANLDWPGFVETAVSEWESRFQKATGRARFLAEDSTVDVPLSLLRPNTTHLDGRVSAWGTGSYPLPTLGWDTLSSWFLPLSTGVFDVSEVRLLTPGGPVNGTLLDAATDYQLTPPEDAPQGDGSDWGRAGLLLPYFERIPVASAGRGFLRVTGTLGTVRTVPDAVRALVMECALVQATPIIQSGAYFAGGGMMGVKRTIEIGPVKTEIGNGSSGSGTSPVFLGDENQRTKIYKRMVTMAARYRPVALF